MRIRKMALLLVCADLFFILPPASAQLEKHKGPSEKLDLRVDTCKDLIPVDLIKLQQATSPQDNGGRAIFLPIVAGYAINKGVQVLQKMISDRQNRYIAQYNFAKTDRCFYNVISTKSAYDPSGIQFKGFTILRTLGGLERPGAAGEKEGDTVFYARFIVDSTAGKYMEIINNGFFRLRLDSIMIRHPKVAHPKDLKTVNLDFDIEFTSTYRTDNGQIYSDANIGKFTLALRNVPVFSSEETSLRYYDSLNEKKPPLTGTCFTIPRSLGFYRTKLGILENCYGLGLYSIKATVKETSKSKFIDKLIIITADPTINIGSSAIQKKLGTPAPSTTTKPPTIK